MNFGVRLLTSSPSSVYGFSIDKNVPLVLHASGVIQEQN